MGGNGRSTIEGLPGVKFIERPNFTPDEVREVLQTAYALAEDVTGEKPFADAVFAAAANMLSNKQILQVQHAPVPVNLDALGLKRH